MAGPRSFKRYVGRTLSQWYWFVIAACIALPIAYAYLYFAPDQYVSQASLMMMANAEAGEGKSTTVSNATDKGKVNDEADILASNSLIERTLKHLDFGIRYFRKNQWASREEYGNRYFTAHLDSGVNQVVDVKIFVKRISSTRYLVRASAKNARLYNCHTGGFEGAVSAFEIEEEVPMDKPFVGKYLSFRAVFNDRYKAEAGDEMYFVIRPLEAVAEECQHNLIAAPLSADSRIVELRMVSEEPSKGKLFLEALINNYLALSSEKDNGQVHEKLRFIDEQLNSKSDTLSDAMRAHLLDKRVEARMAIASMAKDKVVVDKPYVANGGKPVGPLARNVYGIALAAAFASVLLSLLFKEAWRDTIITAEDIDGVTKMPVVGTISHADKREQSTIVAHARTSVGESFRSLRVNLQYLTLNENASVIGITSSREGEGKTFCSVNLAAVMAYAGRRTVLIDTDMRRPRVASYFQLENRKGLSNFLVGDGSVKEIINNTEHKGFDVITSGPIPPNPIDLIGNSRMEELINTLRQSYSTIIIDSPPLGYVSEYIILTRYTDANLYVVRANYSTRKNLKKVNALLASGKAGAFSIVLNDVRPSKESGNYYAYGYGYGYKY